MSSSPTAGTRWETIVYNFAKLYVRFTPILRELYVADISSRKEKVYVNFMPTLRAGLCVNIT
jgi:hypothetical protein